MRPGSFNFNRVIIAAGFALLGMILLNVGAFGLHRHPARPYQYLVGADVERGRHAVSRYGCGGCHEIPGVRDATGRVGPRLHGIADQSYIAGVLGNSPENLVAFIRKPDLHSPSTAMPDLGVTAQDARDIAEFLYQSSAN